MNLTGILPFDAAVMEFVQNHMHNAVTDTIMPIITYLGEIGAVWILLSLLLLCFKKSRTTGVLILVSMAVTFISGELILKNIVCRPRPCHTFPDIPMLVSLPSSFSFPSGHSASSFAAAVILFLRHKKYAWPALFLAALIAFSRIFLFVHYPTDILAGALLGTLSACLTYWIFTKKIQSKQSSPCENEQ